MAANLWFGSINIHAGAVWNTLTGNEVEKASWTFIIWESRLPQAVTALLCGAALAASGLMLQTAFNNPLAGPSILGINSGASLGVALVMLAGGGSIATGVFTLSGFFSVILGAFIGSMVVPTRTLEEAYEKAKAQLLSEGKTDFTVNIIPNCGTVIPLER